MIRYLTLRETIIGSSFLRLQGLRIRGFRLQSIRGFSGPFQRVTPPHIHTA